MRFAAQTLLASLIFALAVACPGTHSAGGGVRSAKSPAVDQLDDDSNAYIPADVDECFVELKKMLSPEDLKAFAALPSQQHVIGYHLGLGMWIRNRWGLWRGSRLRDHMESLGFQKPDEMSHAILSYFWLHLNGKLPLAREETDLVREYRRRFPEKEDPPPACPPGAPPPCL